MGSTPNNITFTGIDWRGRVDSAVLENRIALFLIISLWILVWYKWCHKDNQNSVRRYIMEDLMQAAMYVGSTTGSDHNCN